jgi:hypothetical protein
MHELPSGNTGRRKATIGISTFRSLGEAKAEWGSREVPAVSVTARQISQLRRALLIRAYPDIRAGVSPPLKWLGKAKRLGRFVAN